jgi:lantibiotic modifying enzyme
VGTLAIWKEDRVNWLGLTLLRERDWTIQPVGSDLYSGATGIAYFLAYFDHVVGDADSRAIARTVVRQLTRRLVATLDVTESGTALPPSSLGAFGALSGAVYTLAHIGALWADHDLIDLAERVVTMLGDHVDADRTPRHHRRHGWLHHGRVRARACSVRTNFPPFGATRRGYPRGSRR